jgi:four helix bundle protein
MSDLKIQGVILETIGMLRPMLARIEKCDPDLGRQMRRAAASVALNISEGAYSQGRNANARFYSALGSARETLACVEVAVAFGYVPPMDQDVVERFGRILGTLNKLSR